MKNTTPRTWLFAIVVTLAAATFITFTGWLLASPADQITQAVTASGAPSVSKASADTFLNAFSSALVEADPGQTKAYVDAARKMRPDLSTQITAGATEVNDSAADSTTDDHHVSRHRRFVRICCRGHTLVLPPPVARHFLETHPGCMRGACHHPPSA